MVATFCTAWCRSAGSLPKGADTGPGFVFLYTLPLQVDIEHTSCTFSLVRVAVSGQTADEGDMKELFGSFKLLMTRWGKVTKGSEELRLRLPSKDTVGADPAKLGWQRFFEAASTDAGLPPARKLFPHLVFAYHSEKNRFVDQSILLNFLPRVPPSYLQSVLRQSGVGEGEVAVVDDVYIEQARHRFATHKLTNCSTALRALGGKPIFAHIKGVEPAECDEPEVPLHLPALPPQDPGMAAPITSRSLQRGEDSGRQMHTAGKS